MFVLCLRACVRACVRACARAGIHVRSVRVRARVRMWPRACVWERRFARAAGLVPHGAPQHERGGDWGRGRGGACGRARGQRVPAQPQPRVQRHQRRRCGGDRGRALSAARPAAGRRRQRLFGAGVQLKYDAAGAREQRDRRGRLRGARERADGEQRAARHCVRPPRSAAHALPPPSPPAHTHTHTGRCSLEIVCLCVRPRCGHAPRPGVRCPQRDVPRRAACVRSTFGCNVHGARSNKALSCIYGRLMRVRPPPRAHCARGRRTAHAAEPLAGGGAAARLGRRGRARHARRGGGRRPRRRRRSQSGRA